MTVKAQASRFTHAKVGPVPLPVIVLAVIAVLAYLWWRRRQAATADPAAMPLTQKQGYPGPYDTTGGGAAGGGSQTQTPAPGGGVVAVDEVGRPGTLSGASEGGFNARPGYVPTPPVNVTRPPAPGDPRPAVLALDPGRPGTLGTDGGVFGGPRPAIPDVPLTVGDRPGPPGETPGAVDPVPTLELGRDNSTAAYSSPLEPFPTPGPDSVRRDPYSGGGNVTATNAYQPATPAGSFGDAVPDRVRAAVANPNAVGGPQTVAEQPDTGRASVRPPGSVTRPSGI